MGMFIHRRKQKVLREMVNDRESVKEMAQPKAVDEPVKSTLTEEDINKMPFFTLRSLAAQHGIDTKDKSAKQIRKELSKKIREE